MSDIFGGEADGLDSEFQQAKEIDRSLPPVEERPTKTVNEAVLNEPSDDEPVVRDEPVVEERVELETGKDKTVPLAALNEARAAYRQAQQELAQMRANMAQLESLKSEIEQAREQARQREQEKAFEADPLGAIQREIRSLKEQQAQERTVQQTQAQEQQLVQHIAAQVQDFKATTPDYDQALAHVLQARKNELMEMGSDEMTATRRVAMEAQEIAMNAARTGRNPGEVVYALAKYRGYKPAAPAAPAPEKLEQVEKGQKSSTSLSQASGGADRGFTMSEVENMSDEEFDKWWSKNMSGGTARRH